MKQKTIITILTLLILGLILYFSNNYYYQPWRSFALHVIFFLFVVFVGINKYPHRLILYIVTATFLLITIIGLSTGNVKPDNLLNSSYSFILLFLIPYLLALLFAFRKKLRFLSVVAFLLTNYFCSYFFYFMIDNKSHFNTYDGAYNLNLKNEVISHSFNGDRKRFEKGKIYVVDLWNKGCGVCFLKFPKFGKLKEKYDKNPNIEFIALNVFQEKTEIEPSQKRFEKANLNFPTFFIYQQDAHELKPEFFPITLIIKDNKIVYRGTIETLNALDFLYLKD